jgi:hypothetical protein
MENIQMFFDKDLVASLEQALKRRLVQVNLEVVNIDYSYVTIPIIYPILT